MRQCIKGLEFRSKLTVARCMMAMRACAGIQKQCQIYCTGNEWYVLVPRIVIVRRLCRVLTARIVRHTCVRHISWLTTMWVRRSWMRQCIKGLESWSNNLRRKHRWGGVIRSVVGVWWLGIEWCRIGEPIPSNILGWGEVRVLRWRSSRRVRGHAATRIGSVT